jgi:hypothetical protein
VGNLMPKLRPAPAPQTNLDVALELAAAGIFVFPAIVSWNENAKKLDKKPAITGWREAATTDAARVAEWWRTFPDAVPGIGLGRSGLVVIDLDRHPGGADGVEAFNKLIRNNGLLPPCPTVRTPSGGYHLYFSQANGEAFGNGRGALPLGIDVRGAGGWTVAPGATYQKWVWRWETRH